MKNKIQEFFNVNPNYIASSMKGTNTSKLSEKQHVTRMLYITTTSDRWSSWTLDVACEKNLASN
jgi:hypothetical protein